MRSTRVNCERMESDVPAADESSRIFDSDLGAMFVGAREARRERGDVRDEET